MFPSLKLLFVLFLGFLLTVASDASAKSGSLIIVGGGLQSENQDVWTAFTSRVLKAGPVVIVPSASGQPVQSAEAVRETLIRYGIEANKIAVAPLARHDDRSTRETDESLWVDNVDHPEVIALLRNAAAIWFTGGDQARTTDVLLTDEGDTPALCSIREAHRKGAPIGGTSAGAAIMSESMILQGDSLGALIGPNSGERLQIGKGLGFLETGLVDQHFGERARLGRMAVALLNIKSPDGRIGFGIDENTALIVKPGEQAQVVGAGYVTILDARAVNIEDTISAATEISGLMLHIASHGDKIDLVSLDVSPADWKKATIGQEYRTQKLPAGGGMAVPGQAIQDVLGEGLLDNSASLQIERLSFDGSGNGVLYKFIQTDAATGYWGREPEYGGRYTVKNVEFNISTVVLKLENLAHD